MSCRRFKLAVADYACGAPMDASAAAHLASCTPCRHVLEEERRRISRIDEDLRQALRITASAGFSARVSAQLNGTSAGHEGTRWWMGLAAAAVLALTSYLIVSDRSSDNEPVAPRGTVAGSGPLVSAPGEVSIEGLTALPQAGFDRPGEPASTGSRSAKDAPPRTPARQRRPEILVPPTQLEAVARLRQLVLEGTLDGAPLPPMPLGPVSTEELVIAPLVVPDLVIRDLTSDGDASATTGE